MSNSYRFLSSKCTQLTSIIPACPRAELKQSKLVQQNRSFNRFNISLGWVRSSVRVPKAGETRNSIWKSLDRHNFTSHRVGRRFHKHWRDLLARTVFTMSWSPLIRIHFFSFSQLNSIAAPSVDISEKSTKQRKLKLGYSFSFPPHFPTSTHS